MANLLSISSFHLHDQQVINLKTFFVQKFDFQKTGYNMINQYIIYEFNHEYAKMNVKDYYL